MRNVAVLTSLILTLGLSGAVFADNTLSVVPEAAVLDGNYGMRVTHDGSINNAYVQDDTPDGEKTYYATFHFRQNLTMANASSHNIFVGRMLGTSPATVFRFQMWKAANGVEVVLLWAFDDSGNLTAPIFTVAPNQHIFTIEWKAASAPGANDGVLRLYKGQNLRGEITNIDNDTHVIDQVRLGVIGGADVTTTGTADYDAFVSTRTPQF